MKYKIDPEATRQIDILLHRAAKLETLLGTDSSHELKRRIKLLQSKLIYRIKTICPDTYYSLRPSLNKNY